MHANLISCGHVMHAKCSLVYGDLAQETKQEVIAELGPRFDGASVKVSERGALSLRGCVPLTSVACHVVAERECSWIACSCGTQVEEWRSGNWCMSSICDVV